jgi:hypothetical protein
MQLTKQKCNGKRCATCPIFDDEVGFTSTVTGRKYNIKMTAMKIQIVLQTTLYI